MDLCIPEVKIHLITKSEENEDTHDPRGLNIVTPGDRITTQVDFMRGHGTYVIQEPKTGEKELNSSLAGVIERINKLVCVRPLKTRYQGNIQQFLI